MESCMNLQLQKMVKMIIVSDMECWKEHSNILDDSFWHRSRDQSMPDCSKNAVKYVAKFCFKTLCQKNETTEKR